MTTPDPEESTVNTKLSLKQLDKRLAALEVSGDAPDLYTRIASLEHLVESWLEHFAENVVEAVPRQGLQSDLLIGICEALRCAGINTAARMAEEMEAKYFGDISYDELVLKRYPWMVDYQ